MAFREVEGGEVRGNTGNIEKAGEIGALSTAQTRQVFTRSHETEESPVLPSTKARAIQLANIRANREVPALSRHATQNGHMTPIQEITNEEKSVRWNGAK